MKRYRKIALILIFILFGGMGVAEENATGNATLDPEALKEEAEREYELAEEKYQEVWSGASASKMQTRAERDVYSYLNKSRDALYKENYQESIRNSNRVIEKINKMQESTGPTINVPFIGDLDITDRFFMYLFVFILGLIILLRVITSDIQKREQEEYYKQLSSETILKKPGQLKKFAKDKDKVLRIKVSEILEEDFDKLPVKLQEELVSILADDTDSTVRGTILNAIMKNFNSFPRELRENLIRKFVNDSYWSIRGNVSDVINEHFSNLSKELREESLKKLADDNHKEVRSRASDAIKWNIEHIPYNMKITVLKKFADDTSWMVKCDLAEALAKDFKNIPKDIREELTRKLLNDSESDVRERAKQIISRNFNDLPEDLKEYVLDDLRKY